MMKATVVSPAQTFAVREVREGDDAAIALLLGGLDATSSYRRWFTGAVDLPRATDWAAHPARFDATGLLAFVDDEPVGHGVLVACADGLGEVAFEVAADWRRHGIASALLDHLMVTARVRGMRGIYAEALAENHDMLAVMREHGPHTESRDGPVVTVSLALDAPRPQNTHEKRQP